MVKANAYGHGAVWAARELLSMPGLSGFGVATLEEGRDLRRELGMRARKTRIVIFTGTAAWTEEKGQFCENHNLTPVIQSDSDWVAFLRGGWAERLDYEIMFNTGMNRLGLTPGFAAQVAKALRNRPSSTFPEGVFTHLAMAEEPDSKLTRSQVQCFQAIRRELAGIMPATHFHMANSAGIWNQKQYGLQDLTDHVRPGLALYGIAPWKGAPRRGLQPVMSLEAKVVQLGKLRVGESIGYGGTFKAKEVTPYAILGAGYADGVSRSLGNKGAISLQGQRCRLIGRVSMDLCAIETNSVKARVGDWAQILGPEVDAWELAEAAGTIPYEILTSVSGRVQRIYG